MKRRSLWKGFTAALFMLAFSARADAAIVFVANRLCHTVSMIDLKARKVLHNISVAQKLDIMDMSPDGKWGFVTSREEKALLVLDLANHKQVEAIPLGGDPHGVAFLK